MSVLALATTLSLSAYPGYLPQYSQNEVREYYSALPIIRTVEEVDLGFNSTTNAILDDMNHSFYKCESNPNIIDEHDFVEDIQLKSFAKSFTKVKIKVNKVEKLSITV